MSLATLDVDFLPTVACTGVIKKVHKPEPSKTEGSRNYVAKVDIEPDNGPLNQTSVYLTFDPEWFSRDFNAETD